MCELCERYARGDLPAGVDLWREECAARELDPDSIPEPALRALSILEIVGLTIVDSLCEDPAGMEYLAAAFAAWSRSSANHADVAFGLIKGRVFGEDGPTAPNRED